MPAKKENCSANHKSCELLRPSHRASFIFISKPQGQGPIHRKMSLFFLKKSHHKKESDETHSYLSFTMMPYIVVFLLFLSSLSSASILGPFPNGIPGSGYGCSTQCNAGGSVHYTLEVKLDTYTIPGSKNSTLSQNGNDLKMFTRTFVGVTDESSPFCMNGYNGSTGPLGPCLQVNPGQRMTIKIINNIQNGMEALQQSKVSLEEFYGLASLPLGWLGPLPQTPNDFTIQSTENLPGWDASYDVINFHLHGTFILCRKLVLRCQKSLTIAYCHRNASSATSVLPHGNGQHVR